MTKLATSHQPHITHPLRDSRLDSRPGSRLAVAREQGVTLIELMIVIAITAILASIAYPQYSDYIRKARRTAATSALVQAQTEMEKLYGQQGNYQNAICSDKAPSAVPAGKRKVCPITSPDGGDYTLGPVVLSNNFQNYSITAVAPAGSRQSKDKQCGSFIITQADTGKGSSLSKAATGETAADTTAECW